MLARQGGRQGRQRQAPTQARAAVQADNGVRPHRLPAQLTLSRPAHSFDEIKP